MDSAVRRALRAKGFSVRRGWPVPIESPTGPRARFINNLWITVWEMPPARAPFTVYVASFPTGGRGAGDVAQLPHPIANGHAAGVCPEEAQ